MRIIHLHQPDVEDQESIKQVFYDPCECKKCSILSLSSSSLTKTTNDVACSICHNIETTPEDPNKMYGFLRTTCCPNLVSHFSCLEKEVAKIKSTFAFCINCKSTLDTTIFNSVTEEDNEKSELISTYFLEPKKRGEEVKNFAEKFFGSKKITPKLRQRYPTSTLSAPFYAVMTNSFEALTLLHKQKFPLSGISEKHNYYFPPLRLSVKLNDLKMTNFLLQNGADPNGTFISRPSIFAGIHQNFQMAALLETHGADLTLRDCTEVSPLIALLEEMGKSNKVATQSAIHLEAKLMQCELPKMTEESVLREAKYEGMDTSLLNAAAKGASFIYFKPIYLRAREKLPLLTMGSILKSLREMDPVERDKLEVIPGTDQLPHPIFSAVQSIGTHKFELLLNDLSKETLETLVYKNKDGDLRTIAMEIVFQLCALDPKEGSLAMLFRKLKLLAKKGVNFNFPNNNGETVAHIFARKAKDYHAFSRAILGVLLHQNIDLRVKNIAGNLPIHDYCLNFDSSDDEVIIRDLIDNNMLKNKEEHHNFKNEAEQTPLDISLQTYLLAKSEFTKKEAFGENYLDMILRKAYIFKKLGIPYDTSNEKYKAIIELAEKKNSPKNEWCSSSEKEFLSSESILQIDQMPKTDFNLPKQVQNLSEA